MATSWLRIQLAIRWLIGPRWNSQQWLLVKPEIRGKPYVDAGADAEVGVVELTAVGSRRA
jgi:hypothetical protein